MSEAVDLMAVGAVEWWPLARIVPYARNPKIHDAAGVSQLAGMIKEFGWTYPILVDEDGVILAGHKRRRACESLGLEAAPVLVKLGLSQAQKQAYRIADNKTTENSLWDEGLLKIEINELKALDFDLGLTAFALGELEALLGVEVAAVGDGKIQDFPVADLLAPYPYFGGKRSIAGAVWARFGQVDNYVEPFFGSGAMLLSRPDVAGLETVNDLDGFIANFWRAVAADPDAVGRYVDWPVNENDLLSRHLWLVNQRQALNDKLHADPEAFDAKIAGWWCWGACNWIGAGWCSGDGPWQVDGETVSKANAGRGVNRQLPHLGDAGQGVNRKLPHLGDAGRGVNRGSVEVTEAGQCADWASHLADMMGKLSDRLRRVRVACGDWGRVVTPSVTDRHGLTAVFLDPPYAAGAMEYSAGGNSDSSISDAVRTWCVENGDNPQMRIAFCGYDPLKMPAGWRALRWTAPKGYQNAENAKNSQREIIWFSPHCVEVLIDG